MTDSCGTPSKKSTNSCGAPKNKKANSCGTPKDPNSCGGAKHKASNSCGGSKTPNSCGSSKTPKTPNSCGNSKTPAKKKSNSCGTPTPTTPTAPKEIHACMGLNACKGHDRFANNECAGMGFCATVSHACHALNNCRAQGGCGLFGSEEQQSVPGDNPCAWYGSCAVPINAERLSTDGPNSGKSTWQRARTVFENRMTKKSKRQFGPSPFPDGPPTWWLNDVGSSSSCAAGTGSTSSTSNNCATKRSAGSNSCG